MNAKTKNDFDSVAPYYDVLVKVVFGKSITRSQTEYLRCISDDANVLILGGGSGWIIEEINRRVKDCRIYYIDASEKMISLAKRKSTNANNVFFIHGTEEHIPEKLFYDVVITNFYFDLFNAKGVNEKMGTISNRLTNNVMWIVTDFINEKWWHRIMLWIMYRFFKFTSHIEASYLNDWRRAFQQDGWICAHKKPFYGDFIETRVFRKLL